MPHIGGLYQYIVKLYTICRKLQMVPRLYDHICLAMQRAQSVWLDMGMHSSLKITVQAALYLYACITQAITKLGWDTRDTDRD